MRRSQSLMISVISFDRCLDSRQLGEKGRYFSVVTATTKYLMRILIALRLRLSDLRLTDLDLSNIHQTAELPPKPLRQNAVRFDAEVNHRHIRCFDRVDCSGL